VDDFIRQVKEVGCAVIGQSDEIAPADKKLYDLRNATGTVNSMPLIVSSIMSKKIAAGSHAIILDVKTGSGALMHTLEESAELARSMVEIGELAGKRTMALVTGMDQPLGMYIGNALEVKEAIDILANGVSGRLLDLSLKLGAMMLIASGRADDEDEALVLLRGALRNGKGIEKFAEMIEAQGGNSDVTKNTSLLPDAKTKLPVKASRGGFVSRMDTTAIGEASRVLGAGRYDAGDKIDPAVGIVMAVSIGDFVKEGQPLAFLHINDEKNKQIALEMVSAAIKISDVQKDVPPLIFAEVCREGIKWFV